MSILPVFRIRGIFSQKNPSYGIDEFSNMCFIMTEHRQHVEYTL